MEILKEPKYVTHTHVSLYIMTHKLIQLIKNGASNTPQTKMKSFVVLLLPLLALDVRGNKATVQCNKVPTEFNDCTYK